MAKICPNCGYASADNRRFCTECGASLPESPSPGRSFLEVNYQGVSENDLRFLALARDLNNVVFLIDRDLKFTYANHRVYDVLGISHISCKGKNAAEAGFPEHIASLLDQACRTVIASGEPGDITFRHPVRGTRIHLDLRPVPGPDFTVDRVLGITQPVFSLREESLASAEHTLLMISQVTQMHIQMNALKVRTKLEGMQKATDPIRREQFYQEILVALERLSGLAESLCNQRDMTARELGWWDTADILVRIGVPPGIALETIPPLPEVFADIKLEGVFWHLLAFAARPDGKVTRVRISAEEAPEGCIIRVEDDGAGVPDTMKSTLFWDRYGESKEIGFFVAKQVLAITGIKIRETGVPDKGSCFEIIVPKGLYRVAGSSSSQEMPSGVGMPRGPDGTGPVDYSVLDATPEPPKGYYRFTIPPAPKREPLVRNIPAPFVAGTASPSSDPAAVQQSTPVPPAPARPGVSVPVIPVTEELLNLLQNHNQQFRILAENSLDAVMIFDRDFRFVYGNSASNHAIRIELRTALGKTVREMGFCEYLVPLWEKALQKVIESRRSQKLEYRTWEGEKQHWALFPLAGPDKSVSRVIALDRPVSTLDLTLDLPFRLYLRADIAARRIISEQVSVMHDCLDRAGPAPYPPIYKDFFCDLRAIAGVIREQITAINRIAPDRPGFSVRWQNTGSLLFDLTRSPEMPDGITVETSPPLPEILADNRLPGVFMSLLENSARHGGQEGRIRVSAEVTPAGCVIRVEDNGAGITAEEKEQIFMPRLCDGTCGSLFRAREILSHTCITIHETGMPGKGARFEILVPEGSYRAVQQPVPEVESRIDEIEKTTYDMMMGEIYAIRENLFRISGDADSATLKELIRDTRARVSTVVESAAFQQMKRTYARYTWKPEMFGPFTRSPPGREAGTVPERVQPDEPQETQDRRDSFLAVSLVPDQDKILRLEAHTFCRIMEEVEFIIQNLARLESDPDPKTRNQVCENLIADTDRIIKIIEIERMQKSQYWSTGRRLV